MNYIFPAHKLRLWTGKKGEFIMKKTSNRLLAFVLTLLLIMTVLPVSALAAPEDFTFTISDGGATITGYTGSGGDVSVPAQVKSGDAYYPVVAIGDNAFQGNTSISGLYIPAATVGTYAFFQCSGLTSVTFESSVSQIRGYAFAQCPNLTSITFLHGSSAFVGIEPYAFQLTGAMTKTQVTVSSATNVNPYVKGYDWTGKDIHIFATSGGSGIGKTAEKLQPSVAGGNIIDAKRIKTASEI